MKILLGMSGGVDSSFAAKMLLDEGHQVEGAALVMHEYTEVSCAELSAKELGIPLHVIDVKKAFDEIIKKNFVSEYAAGRTPNPCIICNEKIKLRYMLDYAISHGFDMIATGHYASVVRIDESGELRYAIKTAKDEKKDQSYMLYRLGQDILSRLYLPLSSVVKEDLRAQASEEGLSSAGKKDSQEICFLPDGGYAEYVEGVLGDFPHGNFIDEEGRILGEHKGIIRYTVGQRKGLGIALGERAFVTNIDPLSNTVTLSKNFSGRGEIELSEVVFSGMKLPDTPITVRTLVKVRYTAPLAPATAFINNNGSIRLVFDSPVKASKGQSAVLYSAEGVVMAGGFIS